MLFPRNKFCVFIYYSIVTSKLITWEINIRATITECRTENYLHIALRSSASRVFERGGGARKFENNEDQKEKFLHLESVRFPAQN